MADLQSAGMKDMGDDTEHAHGGQNPHSWSLLGVRYSTSFQFGLSFVYVRVFLFVARVLNKVSFEIKHIDNR